MSEQNVSRFGVKRPSITKCTVKHMEQCNDLLPPFHRNGNLEALPAHSLSTFIADRDPVNLQRIEIHIEFTDRPKRVRFADSVKGGDGDPRRQRLNRRNALKSRESVAERERASVSLSGSAGSSASSLLNLPDLEPATMSTEKEVIGISEDESMDIDVESDSGFRFGERARVRSSQSVHWVKVDDFGLDFFLCSFPQLLTTHHLVHCHRGMYEWIQTDSLLMDIVHRFMEQHDGSTNDISLRFQIRPRSDTKSDAKSIANAKQFVVDGLRRIDRVRKDEASSKRRQSHRWNALSMSLEDDDENENALFLVRSDDDDDDDIDLNVDHHRYAAIYNDDSQHLLMEDVIEAIHQNENGPKQPESSEQPLPSSSMSSHSPSPSAGAGSWQSGLCGLCHQKYSMKQRALSKARSMDSDTASNQEQHWIECGVCNKWYHQDCSGLDEEQYAAFQQDEGKTYRCLICNEQ